MQQPSIVNILGTGWTYCPRCNADSMVTDGASWLCPFCGIRLTIVKSPPMPPDLMVWSEQLNEEEIKREFSYLQNKATAWAADQSKTYNEVPPKPCRRVRACMRLLTALAWLFGCKPVAVMDKKHKEATG